MAVHQVDWKVIAWEPIRGGTGRKTFTGEGARLALHRIQPGHELRPHTHHYEQIIQTLRGRKYRGITAMRAILMQADARGIRIVPHRACLGAGFVTTLYVAAALPGLSWWSG